MDIKLKIVIAEDDTDSAIISKKFIKDICDDPIITKDGREVVQIIKDHPETEQKH